jgi:hypothetical protein
MFCRTLLAVACVVSFARPSIADLRVQFLEGAPKDRFVLTNQRSCRIENAWITIDLSGSKGGLIFDVAKAGSGVGVFQPFEVVSGAESLVRRSITADGDQSVTLHLSNLEQQQSVVFAVDVDDTSGAREITVTDNEMAGSTVSVLSGEVRFRNEFERGAEALLNIGECP